MNYDEDYVKDLERQIERQQEQVDKYSMFIKRLDELNIKMSMQDCSQFIKPGAFIRWLENSNTWKLTAIHKDAYGTTKRFTNIKIGRSFTILTEYTHESQKEMYLRNIIDAFQCVWDVRHMEHCGKFIVSLIVEIMEYEDI